MGDDVKLDQDLTNMNSRYIPQLEMLDADWDMLYLAFNHDVDLKGHFLALRDKAHLMPNWVPKLIRDNFNNAQFWTDQQTRSPFFVRPRPRWGLFGTVISQKGAQKLLKMVEHDGINWPVDWQVWFQREPETPSGLHI